MNNAALMTQTAFAAHRGVGRSAVSNWKKAGFLVFTDGGMVDVEASEARLKTSIDRGRGRPTSGMLDLRPEGQSPAAQGEQLGEVRADLLREQRIGLKLKNGREAGQLVLVGEYENRLAELARLTRERMHGIARAQSERIAAEHDPRAIVAILAAEIDRTFGELADQAAAGAFALADEADEAEPPAAD